MFGLLSIVTLKIYAMRIMYGLIIIYNSFSFL